MSRGKFQQFYNYKRKPKKIEAVPKLIVTIIPHIAGYILHPLQKYETKDDG